MIASAELKRMAGHSGIHYGVLERDYCLGWMLYGISREPALYHGMVFKGGTALKKCYFGEFRFSQDLDYTCRKGLPLSELETLIQDACRNAADTSGIEFKLAEFSKTRSVNGEEAFVAKINYRGPSNPRTMLPRIQLDLTYYEDIILQPQEKPILHYYSDTLSKARAWCYSLEEILAEKLRAVLQQRQRVPRPRDYYDLWWVLSNKVSDKALVRQAFAAKCRLKNESFKSVQDFFNKVLLAKNRAAWNASIGKQVKDVPAFDEVVGELRPLIERLL